ncbi:hypothetical protein ACTWPM_02075 [Halobacillus sp. K22]
MSVWIEITLLLQAALASGLGLLIDRFSPSAGFICMSGLMVVGVGVKLVVDKRT